VPTPYNDEFFFWWRRQVIAMDDYPYAGIDYRGDPDMPLPPGSAYGDIGMKNFFFYIFHFFVFFSKKNKKCKYFWMVSSIKKHLLCRCGSAMTRWIPMTSWRNRGDEPVGGDAERVLQNVQGNLSRLMHKIPMVQVEDLPEAMQRQVVGVPRAWV
jgi:hypothetical protein